MAKPDTLGAKLGPRVASLAAKATLLTKVQAAPHTTRIAMKAVDDYINMIGDEMRVHADGYLSQVADHPDTPRWARKLIGFVARGHGEAQALLSFAVYGSGLSNALSTFVSNELQPAVGRLIADNPNQLVPVSTAISLLARKIWPRADAEVEVRRQGIDRDRQAMMERASLSPPGIGELLQLLNRKLTNDTGVREALRDNGILDDWHDGVIALREQLLEPASLADMVVRGIIEETPAAHEAELQGVSGDRFAKLALQAGEPPAIEQLLFLYRRGKIDQARLVHGIRQSRVRNEWVDAIEALQYVPLSPEAAVQAAVQGHLSLDAAKQRWREGGIDPADFEAAYETAGEPIAIGQALDLWNRGKMTQPEVETVIRESRLKNKYIPFVEQLRYYLPPVRTIVALLRQHAVTDDYARQLFAENGVRPADAQAYIDEAHNTRSSAHRAFTTAQVQTFFRDGAITEAEARSMLDALGWSADEVQLIITNAQLEQLNRARNQAIERVRSSYVGHKIDRTAAAADLNALHVTDTNAAQLLDLWDDQLAANVRVLTEAQVIAAVKKNLLTADDGFAYLQFLGYGSTDAAILLATAGHPPTGA